VDAWDILQGELDCWADEGRQATLWWRDDDAIDITPELNDLTAISSDSGVPIMLAVVPAHLTPEIKSHTFSAEVRLAQHGYAHNNHGQPDTKKFEFGPQREMGDMIAEITMGFHQIMALKNGISTFVPPWNRIDRDLLPAMQQIGFSSVSAFTPREQSEPVAGLRQVNTHADLVDWRGSRGFAGEKAVLGQVVGHLAARRAGTVDSDEPTGLLTHHLVHDADCWHFLEMFTHHTLEHPGATWLPIDTAMAA